MNTLAVSPLQSKMIELIAQGLPTQEIANRLNLGQREAEAQLSTLLQNLGLASRIELILLAYSRNPSAPPHEA